ncbi:MAG: LytTR family DNA-binding domain-containing protein [Pseudomonadota bacterium]
MTTLWFAGSIVLTGLYAGIFLLAGSEWNAAFRDALANVIPLAGLAAVAHALIRQFVFPLSAAGQAAIHLVAAPAFALAWYSLLVMLLAVFARASGQMFELHAFAGPAVQWQAFQGLILYALVAAVTYSIRGGRIASEVTIVDQTPPLGRYLARDGDSAAPIDVSDIVSISGAQDYSEVATTKGRHLVRLSLGEFENRLDRHRFLRVHRSAIINFDRVERVEPVGGGRMIAWMSNGESVAVSRAGASILRSLMV